MLLVTASKTQKGINVKMSEKTEHYLFSLKKYDKPRRTIRGRLATRKERLKYGL